MDATVPDSALPAPLFGCIIPKLIAGESGQLVGHGILTLTSEELVMFLLRLTFSTDSRFHSIVILHEESGTRTVVAVVIHGQIGSKYEVRRSISFAEFE